MGIIEHFNWLKFCMFTLGFILLRFTIRYGRPKTGEGSLTTKGKWVIEILLLISTTLFYCGAVFLTN